MSNTSKVFYGLYSEMPYDNGIDPLHVGNIKIGFPSTSVIGDYASYSSSLTMLSGSVFSFYHSLLTNTLTIVPSLSAAATVYNGDGLTFRGDTLSAADIKGVMFRNNTDTTIQVGVVDNLDSVIATITTAPSGVSLLYPWPYSTNNGYKLAANSPLSSSGGSFETTVLYVSAI